MIPRRRALRPLFAAIIAATLALAAPGRPAQAQFGFPSPDQADMQIDAAAARATVASLAAALDTAYVFPEVGRKVGQALLQRSRKGEYDRISSAKELADSLTAHLRATVHDRHLRVHYYADPLPEAAANLEQTPEQRALAGKQARRLNHGFSKFERLAGNVGYLELVAFDGSPEAGERALAAMTLLADSDALIVDLRRNGGGDPNMIDLLLSRLFPADERVHVNDFYQRRGNATEQFWTLTTIPGPRYVGKDVYVLVSPHTASAAEEFAYDVQNLKRGTLVGETTAGAANPGGLVRLGAHFAAFVPDGRAVSPITKTNWEGVGVVPDVKVSADEALKTAHVAAVSHLLDHATTPEDKAWLERALGAAKSAPVQPLDLGMRRVARSGS